MIKTIATLFKISTDFLPYRYRNRNNSHQQKILRKVIYCSDHLKF